MSFRARIAIALVLLSSALAVTYAAAPEARSRDSSQPGKLLRHVVLFKFKEGTSPDQLKQIVDAFRSLPGKIDVIQAFEWGTDVSVENKAEGFTHCFFVTFRDEKGRDAYLPHAAHKEFVSIVRPHVDKVLVVDYWSQG